MLTSTKTKITIKDDYRNIAVFQRAIDLFATAARTTGDDNREI